MTRRIEAVVEPDGRVLLAEPLHPATTLRAIVTVYDDPAPESRQTAQGTLSGPDLEAAFESQPRPRGATVEDLLPVYGILDRDSAREMMQIIDDEFEQVDPDEW